MGWYVFCCGVGMWCVVGVLLVLCGVFFFFFTQKAAYACFFGLVGSVMGIGDRSVCVCVCVRVRVRVRVRVCVFIDLNCVPKHARSFSGGPELRPELRFMYSKVSYLTAGVHPRKTKGNLGEAVVTVY